MVTHVAINMLVSRHSEGLILSSHCFILIAKHFKKLKMKVGNNEIGKGHSPENHSGCGEKKKGLVVLPHASAYSFYQ